MAKGRHNDHGFLVLERRKDQRILIGDNIIVVVSKIDGDRVYLGVKAPKGILVDREEVRLARSNNKPTNEKSAKE